MSKAVEREIQKIYSAVFNKIYTKTRLAALAKGSRLGIVESVSLLESSDAYNEFAKKFATELAKKGMASKRGIWRKYYNAARKLHYVALPKTYAEYEAKIMSNAVKNNFDMIKSIPREALKVMEHDYTSTLIEEVAKGKLTRGSFRRELEMHGAKNAKLIARTESAKLQTVILETRSTELGSVAYIWKASNDARTRQSHKDMDGVVVFWRPAPQKPLRDKMRGNAGEFPNCRCSPQPIVDFDDLTKSNYKVYDYRSDTIISMTRAKLVESLTKGSLG